MKHREVLQPTLKELKRDDILDELEDARRHVIEETRSNPGELMKWLYEKQGEMRFGAENRIYLVLADLKGLSKSWKLKRAFSIIEPHMQKYIEEFTPESLKTI